MLWVYGHYKVLMLGQLIAGIDFSRQILTSKVYRRAVSGNTKLYIHPMLY